MVDIRGTFYPSPLKLPPKALYFLTFSSSILPFHVLLLLQLWIESIEEIKNYFFSWDGENHIILQKNKSFKSTSASKSIIKFLKIITFMTIIKNNEIGWVNPFGMFDSIWWGIYFWEFSTRHFGSDAYLCTTEWMAKPFLGVRSVRERGRKKVKMGRVHRQRENEILLKP